MEGIPDLLVSRTASHLAGVRGRHGHCMSFLHDSGFEPDRDGNYLGMDLARYLRSLGPDSDPEDLLERAIKGPEQVRRDKSSTRTPCRALNRSCVSS